ncbi:MAG TPA: hypothetical protein VGI50_11885 [Solirubrobacteraceae bacterium]|jgi:uncharacterized membrane protein
MGSRLAGRLLTSPAAFLLAGVVEFLVYWLTVVRRATRRRVRGQG